MCSETDRHCYVSCGDLAGRRFYPSVSFVYSGLQQKYTRGSSRKKLSDTGDWLKYDLIDEATQQLLTALAVAGVIVHSGIGAACASQAISRAPDAALPIAAIAFLRGFLCGTPELLLILAQRIVECDND